MKKNNKRRKRSDFSHLDLNDRVQIEISYCQGKSLNEIAKILGKRRDKSTISREIDGRPNKGRGRYRAYQANVKALERDKHRGRRGRLKSEATQKVCKEKDEAGLVSGTDIATAADRMRGSNHFIRGHLSIRL